jgi:hypothetical protein
MQPDMRNLRTPGTGITGATETLGGEISKASIPDASLPINDLGMRHAAALDREADALLFVGNHALAERLAHEAADLRAGVAL